MIVRFCNLDWSSPPYTYRSTTVRWHIYLELHNAHTHTHTHTRPRALKDTCQTDSVIAMVTQYVGMAAKFLIHNCACLNTSLFIPEKEKKKTHTWSIVRRYKASSSMAGFER